LADDLKGIASFGVVFELPCACPQKLKPSLLAVFNYFAYEINKDFDDEDQKLTFDAFADDAVLKIYTTSIPTEMQKALGEIEPLLNDVIGQNYAEVNVDFGTKASPKTINWEEFILYEKRFCLSHLLKGSELDVELRLPQGIMDNLTSFLSTEEGREMFGLYSDEVAPILALLNLKQSKIELEMDDVIKIADKYDRGDDGFVEIMKDFSTDSFIRDTVVRGPQIFRDLVKGLMKTARSEFKLHLGWGNICASFDFSTKHLSSWWQMMVLLHQSDSYGTDRNEIQEKRKEADLEFRKRTGELTEDEYDKLTEPLEDVEDQYQERD